MPPLTLISNHKLGETQPTCVVYSLGYCKRSAQRCSKELKSNSVATTLLLIETQILSTSRISNATPNLNLKPYAGEERSPKKNKAPLDAERRVSTPIETGIAPLLGQDLVRLPQHEF
jgi:hypothetical protein